MESEILQDVSSETPGFAVYPVTRSNLSAISRWPASHNVRRFDWITHQAAPSDIRIQPFDSINLVIWDSEENSLLTAPTQKLVEIPDLRVGANGNVFVPYLGYVSVVGKTPDGARNLIEREMVAIVPSAQVQLNVLPGTRGSVSLIGGVASPGTVPLPEGNFTVLNLISQGGGPATARNPQVRLIRSGKTYGTSLETIVENPSYDTVLRGGDKVALVEDERYFRALGATGQEQIVPFDDDTITALDAMSMGGGIDERRANPQGILVLREYPGSAVGAGTPGPSNTRTVFTIDLTSADGLFSAGRFPIYSGDTLLVTESPVNAATTVLGIVGTVTGITNRFPQ